jgi:thiol-disulfide isomerase/thioredoxin
VKGVFYSILISCPLITFSQHSFTITCRISGLSSGNAKLVKYNEFSYKSKRIDSVAIEKGSFTFTGKLDYPQMLHVILFPGNWSFKAFVENSEIKIAGDTTGSEYYADFDNTGRYIKGAHLRNVTVTGSRSHDDWMAYNNDSNQTKYDLVLDELGKKMSSAKSEKNDEAEYKIREQYDSVKALRKQKELNWINHYVDINPSSTAGVYIFSDFYRYSNPKLNEFESVLKKFSGLAVTSDYYSQLATFLDKRKSLTPGNEAPDFTLFMKDNKRFTLSSYRGKYVLLDFWASWCYPCRKAIPHWKAVHANYHAKGFDIISITNDYDRKAWIKAMNQEKMPWLQLIDKFPSKSSTAEVATRYNVDSIPFYVLLDKEGKIMVYSDSEEAIDDKLKEIFN